MSFDWGGMAGGVQDTLEQLLQKRILEERMALAQRQQAAEEQHRAAVLGEQRATRAQQGDQFGQRLGFDREVHQAGEPGRIAGVRQANAAAGRTEQVTAQEAQEEAERRAADAEVSADPVLSRVLKARKAGIQTAPTNVLDPEGETEFGRRQQIIRLSGDQSVRAAREAAAGRAQNPFYKTDTVPGERDGKPGKVTRGYSTDGSIVDIAFEPAPDTAAEQDRDRARAELARRISLIKPLVGQLNSGAGFGQLMRGWKNKAGAATNLNEVARSYDAMRQPLQFTLARASGSNSQLAVKELMMAGKLLPEFGDPKDVAALKIANLDMMANAKTPEELDAVIEQIMQGWGLEYAEQGAPAGPAVGERRQFP